MDSFIYSINATVPIFLVMIIGWFIKQIGLIDDHFANVANRYVFKVALPALLFRDLSKSDFKGKFDPQFVLYCSIVTILMFSLVWIATEILMKDDTQKGAFVQGSCRSSAAILGMAFVQNMYSDTGMAPLMIIGTVPLYNAFAVIVLSLLKPGQRKMDKALLQKTLKGIVTNPIILGIAAGFVWAILKIPQPEILQKTVKNMAVLATPLGLMAMGASFEGKKALGKLKPTLIASALKLVVLAAIFLPIAVWLGYRESELVAILVMLGSATTVSSFVMARNMGHEGVLTSSIVMVTTLCSAFTLTGWLFLLKTLGLV